MTDTPAYGFDLSTKRIAVAALDHDSQWVASIPIAQDMVNRPLAAATALRQAAMDTIDIGAAFVEYPAMGVGVRSTIEQAFVSGVVQSFLAEQWHTVEMVNVSTWKKVVVGNGHATKQQIASYVEQHLPEWAQLIHEAEPRSKERRQDLFDAVCILRYGITERLGYQ